MLLTKQGRSHRITESFGLEKASKRSLSPTTGGPPSPPLNHDPMCHRYRRLIHSTILRTGHHSEQEGTKKWTGKQLQFSVIEPIPYYLLLQVTSELQRSKTQDYWQQPETACMPCGDASLVRVYLHGLSSLMGRVYICKYKSKTERQINFCLLTWFWKKTLDVSNAKM